MLNYLGPFAFIRSSQSHFRIEVYNESDVYASLTSCTLELSGLGTTNNR